MQCISSIFRCCLATIRFDNIFICSLFTWNVYSIFANSNIKTMFHGKHWALRTSKYLCSHTFFPIFMKMDCWHLSKSWTKKSHVWSWHNSHPFQMGQWKRVSVVIWCGSILYAYISNIQGFFFSPHLVSFVYLK